MPFYLTIFMKAFVASIVVVLAMTLFIFIGIGVISPGGTFDSNGLFAELGGVIGASFPFVMLPFLFLAWATTRQTAIIQCQDSTICLKTLTQEFSKLQLTPQSSLDSTEGVSFVINNPISRRFIPGLHIRPLGPTQVEVSGSAAQVVAAKRYSLQAVST